MATVSNPATLQSVINTFGSGGSPTNLYAYRRGQSYVPDVPAYSGVSTTQPALSTFAGLVYPALNLPNYNAGTYSIELSHSYFISPAIFDTVFAYVGIQLNSDGSGKYYYGEYGSAQVNFTTFTWLLTGSASDYYAYMDAPGGNSFSIGTVTTSLQLNSTRYWELQANAASNNFDIKSLTSTLRIKNSGGTDLTAKTLLMSAEAYNTD